MTTIVDDFSQRLAASTAAGARRPWLVAGGTGRALGRRQGHHQQDRARRGQPDRRHPGQAGERLRPDPGRPDAARRSSGDRLSRPASSRSGAIPKPAIRASRCSAAPTIRSNWSRSRCRRDSSVTLPASSYVHIRQVVWVLRGSLVIIEGRRASSARHRRLPRLRPAGRGDLRQRDRLRPATMSWRLAGARMHVRIRIAAR